MPYRNKVQRELLESSLEMFSTLRMKTIGLNLKQDTVQVPQNGKFSAIKAANVSSLPKFGHARFPTYV